MSTLGKSLKVVERERFFDDAFFREAWDDFERAMQSVLDKFDNTGLRVDAGSRTQCQDVYSKIRSNNIDEDLYASQAIQINEKDGKFQAVMDVKDFNPRELQVRAVDDRILVEGSYQKVSEDGSSSSCKSFYKEFALPAAADIDLVSTALSKDGILTIKAPKKEGCAVGDGVQPSGSSSSCNTSSSAQQSSSFSDSNSSFKSSSSRTVVQSSSTNLENSGDGYDSLPKEMRDKLMFCDSGFGSTKTSTCSSPAPSEAGSESSRVSSTMEFDLTKKAPVRTEVAFNVSTPSQSSQSPNYQQQSSLQSKFQPPPSQQQFQQQAPSQYSQYQQQPPQPQFCQQPQQQYQPSPQPQFQCQSPPQSPPFQQPSQFQSPPPQSQFQSPPLQSQFQSPPPQSQFQSPPPQTQYQSPPQSPFQKQQPQSQFQQQPLHSNFRPQQPPPFTSPQGTPEMFQQFSQIGGQGGHQSMAPAAPQPPKQPTSSVAVGSGKQSNINITEKNGRRVLTSQTSNVVQEKDGFMEHRETAAEITDKDSQAARREASSKMSRVEEDPKGKFKRSESADAAEVSESCVQQLPDGSVMSVKKNSSSTSSFKQSFSSSSDDPFFQPPQNFPSGFEDFRTLMGRGPNLMSQMSTDSMASTLSGRSGFTDMSNFSHFSDTSSQFSDMPNFNMSSFPTMGQMPSSRFNQQQTSQQQQQQQQQFKTGPGGMGMQDFNSPGLSKSFSNSFSSSSFSKSSFSSSFGDGNF